jgi:iron(III) transport system permease protein
MDGSVISRSMRWQQCMLIGSAGVLFAGVALLPLLWPLVELQERESAEILRSLEVFASSRPWILLSRSLGLAVAVVVSALVVGIPLGVLLARTDIAGRRVLVFVHGFPMFLPPFLLALGWFYLFGQQGFLGGEASSRFFFHEVGHVVVLGLAFAPVVTTLVVLGLWNVDPSLEEAARVSARPLRVATGILLPAAWPSITLASILVFALSFSELGVPMFLRVDVYPAAIFSRLGAIDHDPGEAFLLALPLVPVTMALVFAERWRRRPVDVLGLRHRNRAPLPLGVWRGLLSAACWGLTILSLLPVALLALKAGVGGGFASLSDWVGWSIANSLFSAGIAATAIVGIGVVLGHALARGLPGSRLLDLIAVLTFVVPAVLLGVGLIAVWNRPATQFIYGGVGILTLGYTARYGIVGIRTVAVAVAQSPLSLEQAGATFGAGFLRRFVSIVLPLHGRALGAAWLLAVVFCLRDLETAVLYYPPGSEPLTVRVFTLEANGPEAIVAGLAILHVTITAFVLMVGSLLLTRRRRT